MGAMDDYLITHARGVRELVHLLRVQPGHACGRRQREPGRGTTGDIPGFRARHLGDYPAGCVLKLINLDVVAGGIRHGLEDGRLHD